MKICIGNRKLFPIFKRSSTLKRKDKIQKQDKSRNVTINPLSPLYILVKDGVNISNDFCIGRIDSETTNARIVPINAPDAR